MSEESTFVTDTVRKIECLKETGAHAQAATVWEEFYAVAAQWEIDKARDLLLYA